VSRGPRIAAAALALLMAAAAALALRCLSPGSASCSLDTLFRPAPALDVPYAGTRPEVVALMLELAEVGPRDHVLDLGTGDGRILIAAAQDHGASGLGVDLDPVLVRRAERNARRAGVAERTRFAVADIFETPFGEADVVAMFLLPEVNLRLRPRLLAELRPGARIVSHAFDMGDWRPDREGRAGGGRAYMWIVPASAAGRWRVEGGDGRAIGELHLAQRFQALTGTLRAPDGAELPLLEPRIEGARISFEVEQDGARRSFTGRIEEGRMDGAEGSWRAVRTGG
jgi:SAM-dependent methyltransferase